MSAAPQLCHHGEGGQMVQFSRHHGPCLPVLVKLNRLANHNLCRTLPLILRETGLIHDGREGKGGRIVFINISGWEVVGSDLCSLVSWTPLSHCLHSSPVSFHDALIVKVCLHSHSSHHITPHCQHNIMIHQSLNHHHHHHQSHCPDRQ